MTAMQTAGPRTPTRTAARAVLSQVAAQIVDAWYHPCVRQGFVAVILIVLGAFSPAFVAADHPLYTWGFFSVMLSEPARFASSAVVLVGLLQLFDAWLGLRPTEGRPTAPVWAAFWWILPVVAAPPLFSRDSFSYAAQGLVVSRGMDPYATGPIAVPGPFADQVDPMWLFTPAPYGPLALQVQRMIVEASGGHAFLAAIGMRIPALISVAAIAWALPKLAERMGVSRHQAVWLGVLNPLLIMHFAGGAHNDAMMVALVVVGLLFATDGRLVAASALVATGASFKQTGVLVLAGVAGALYRHSVGVRGEAALSSPVDMRAFVKIAVKVGLVAFVTFAAISLVSGLGWGWLHNLGVPGMVVSLLSPVTLAGTSVAGALSTIGVPAAWTAGIVPAFHKIGLLGTLVALAWLTFRVAPRRPVAAAAWSLMAFTIGSPTVYAWYVLWGVVLLGATRVDRRVLGGLVFVTGWLIGYTMMDMAFLNGAAMVGPAAVTWGVISFARRWRSIATPFPHVADGDPAPAPDEVVARAA